MNDEGCFGECDFFCFYNCTCYCDLLNHDTSGIKSQVNFLTNCQILLSIRRNMLTKQKKTLTLDQTV